MKVTLATLIAALAVAGSVHADISQVVPGKTPTGQQTYEQGQIPPTIKYALDQLNQIRAAHGLSKLCINRALQTAAQGGSDWQAANKQMAHMPDGQLKARYSNAGYDWGGYVENVAVNVIGVDSTSKGTCFGSAPYVKVADDQTSAQYVTNCQWWNSEGHRKNMLTPEVNQVGIAFTKGEWEGYGNSYYWTQDFGISAQPCISDQVVHDTPVVSVSNPPTQPKVVVVTKQPVQPKVVVVTQTPEQPKVVVVTKTQEPPKVVVVTKAPEQPKVVYVTKTQPPAPVVTVTPTQTTPVVTVIATQTVPVVTVTATQTVPVVTVTATQPAYTSTAQVTVVPTSTIDVPESPAETEPVPTATYPAQVIPTATYPASEIPVQTVPIQKCHKVTRTITKCKKVATATYPVVPVVPTATTPVPSDEEDKEDTYGTLEVPEQPAASTPAYGTTPAVVPTQGPSYGTPVSPVVSSTAKSTASASASPSASANYGNPVVPTATPSPAYGGKSLVDGNSDGDSLY